MTSRLVKSGEILGEALSEARSLGLHEVETMIEIVIDALQEAEAALSQNEMPE